MQPRTTCYGTLLRQEIREVSCAFFSDIIDANLNTRWGATMPRAAENMVEKFLTNESCFRKDEILTA